MTRIEFDRLISVQDIRAVFAQEFGSELNITSKKNIIRIVQSPMKACCVLVREIHNNTVCEISPYIPSPWIGIPIAFVTGLVGLFVLQSKVTQQLVKRVELVLLKIAPKSAAAIETQAGMALSKAIRLEARGHLEEALSAYGDIIRSYGATQTAKDATIALNSLKKQMNCQ
ncbi:MAG: hypothetical protein WCO26_22025 [Deltaproteobacteria bacterium]